MSATALFLGLGEIGRPLFELAKAKIQATGADIQPVDLDGPVSVMHVSYPFDIPDFIGTTVEYARRYKPGLIIIHATVTPGTTREVSERTGIPAANSPVRGKHARMTQDLLHYTKFVGGVTPEAGRKAAEHLQSFGLKTKIVDRAETSELAKLTETTYFGHLIAWHQEVERYCKAYGANYDDVVSIYDEIGFFPPVKYYPGVIGGHCVMPNIKILKTMFTSGLLDAIEKSNEMKKADKGMEGWTEGKTQTPAAPQARFKVA